MNHYYITMRIKKYDDLKDSTKAYMFFAGLADLSVASGFVVHALTEGDYKRAAVAGGIALIGLVGSLYIAGRAFLDKGNRTNERDALVKKVQSD